jgi:nitrate/TMAO reductase-like tetraheme cytochrome c subunit
MASNEEKPSPPDRRRRGFWIAGSIVVGVLLLAILSAVATDQSLFCDSCHEMRPYYKAWVAGPHYRPASCVECHVAPGIPQDVAHKFTALSELWAHFTSNPMFPAPGAAQRVSSSWCVQCHASKKDSPAGFDFSHKKHAAKGIQCVVCHSQTGHAVTLVELRSAGILRPGTTVPYSESPIPAGKAGNPVPGHAPVACIRCHDMLAMRCTACHVAAPGVHVAGKDCAKCHTSEKALWSSAKNLHSASAQQILGVADHNRAEVPKDDCLLCHSMFQAIQFNVVVDPAGTAPGTKIPKSSYGPVDDPASTYYSGAISHFITPVNAKGPWTITNGTDWQATKCEVCHEPSSTAKDKLAKYGAWLDTQPKAAYIQLDQGMPTAYSYLFKKNSYTRSVYTSQTAFAVHATKLCDSCHDPDDQGGDPAKVIGGVNYGPQGGDSRAYMTTSHVGLGCIDCHKTHDFTPEEDTAAVGDSKCNEPGCHTTAAKLAGPSGPGVVHTNHIP